MSGKTNLSGLIRSMKPVLNDGDYVYCMVGAEDNIDVHEAICFFREKEGLTQILPKQVADARHITYEFIASWITLTVHSSLEAVGLTAAVSKALAEANISCNSIAAYNHDHIFVAKKDADRAMNILRAVSKQ
jgi:uncharacterized protein